MARPELDKKTNKANTSNKPNKPDKPNKSTPSKIGKKGKSDNKVQKSTKKDTKPKDMEKAFNNGLRMRRDRYVGAITRGNRFPSRRPPSYGQMTRKEQGEWNRKNAWSRHVFKCLGFQFDFQDPVLTDFVMEQHARAKREGFSFANSVNMREYMTVFFRLCNENRALYDLANDYDIDNDTDDGKVSFFKIVASKSEQTYPVVEPESLLQLVDIYSKGRRDFVKLVEPKARLVVKNQDGDVGVEDAESDDDASAKTNDKQFVEEQDGLMVKLGRKTFCPRDEYYNMLYNDEKLLIHQVDKWNQWIDQQNGNAVDHSLFDKMVL